MAVDSTEEITGEGDGKEDFDWDSYLEDYGSMGTTYTWEDVGTPSWDNVLTKKATLTDHLMWQLNLSRLSNSEKLVGGQIIGNLDINGYLTASLDEISEREEDHEGFVEKVIKKIQEFDPPGVAARDLKECLLIQGGLLGISTPLVETIIKEYLQDLETKNYNNIAKKLKVQLSDVLEYVSQVNELHTEGIKDSTILEFDNIIREDIPKMKWEREDLLTNAPKQKEGYIVVPEVFKEREY